MKLPTVKSFVASIFAAVLAMAASAPTRAEKPAQRPDARKVYLLVPSGDVPAPPKSLLQKEWTGISWDEGLECLVTKTRLKASVDENGFSVVDSDPPASLVLYGLTIPVKSFPCAKRIDTSTKGSNVDPRLSHAYASFTYQFSSGRISVFPEIKNDRVQVVYKSGDRTQVIFRAASTSASLMTWIEVRMLGDLDGDGAADLWLYVPLDGGGEKVHDILYLSGEAEGGTMMKEIARNSTTYDAG